MNGVVAAELGFVAVGGANGHAAAWTSTDGLTWERAELEDSTALSSHRSVIMDVALGDGGFVGVGIEQRAHDSRAAVWTSPDGRRWRRAPHQRAFGTTGYQSMNTVTSGGPGFVAAGWAEYDPDRDTTSAAFWASADGKTWRRVLDSSGALRVGGVEGIFAVSTSPRGLVAAGRDGKNVALWTSHDAKRWLRVPHDEALFGGDQVMWSLVAGSRRLVAVGYQNGGLVPGEGEHAVAWTSPDGHRWSRLEVRAARQTSWRAVATRGGTVIAAGSENTGDFDVAIWSSQGGDKWKRMRAEEAVFGGPGNQLARDLAIGEERAVAVGADYWNGPRPAAWSAALADG